MNVESLSSFQLRNSDVRYFPIWVNNGSCFNFSQHTICGFFMLIVFLGLFGSSLIILFRIWIKAVLAAGADVNSNDGKGWTALMRAAEHGHFKTVKVGL